MAAGTDADSAPLKDPGPKRALPRSRKTSVCAHPEGCNDNRNVVLEIRAGTGKPTALFASDLFRMYRAMRSGSAGRSSAVEQRTGVGGLKAIATVEGRSYRR